MTTYLDHSLIHFHSLFLVVGDVYEVTTSEREGAISNYGFVNNLDSIPWVYSLYSLRFGADAPNDGQISVVLHGYSGM